MPTGSENTGQASAERVAIAFLGVTLLATQTGVRPLAIPSAAPDFVGGDPLNQLFWGSLAVVAVGLLAWRPADARRVLRGNPWIPLVVLAALLSATWSTVPLVSLRRAALLAATAAGAVAVAALVRDDEGLLRGLELGTAAWLGGSLAAVLLVPARAIDADGAWMGLSTHKSHCGLMALLTVAAWLPRLVGPTRIRLRATALAVGAGAGLVVWKSASLTGQVLCAVAVVSFALGELWRRSRWLAAGVTAVGLGVGVMAVPVVAALAGVPDVAALLGAVGKDATLTGRTDVWGEMVASVAHSWPLGTGYGGFWLGAEGPSGDFLGRTAWLPAHAHNGYLDLLNETGLVGAVPLAGALVVGVRRAVRLVARGAAGGAWRLLVLGLFAMLNCVETAALSATHAWWIVFCVVSLARDR